MIKKINKKKVHHLLKLLFLLILPLLIICTYLAQKIHLLPYIALVPDIVIPIPDLQVITQPNPTMSWLTTEGNKIINDKNETVILRGVNLASTDWGYDSWNAKAVSYAAKYWKAQVIRARVNPKAFSANENEFFRNLEDQVIKPAKDFGVYVILHSFIPQSINDLPTPETIKMWQAIAKRYKSEPIILYDPISEPHNTTKEKIRQAYLELIPKIREINSKALIFVTGLGYGREINSYLNNPLPFDNLVYRSNPYNRSAEFESLFGKIALVYPVFIGEFGADGYPEMSQQSVRDLIAYTDKLGIGWTAWNFHSLGCPCLLADWRTFKPSPYGEIIKNALTQAEVFTLSNIEVELLTEAGLTIYDDQFHYSFVEQGWQRDINLQNTEHAYQGKTSLKVKFNDKIAGINLFTYDLVDPTKYEFLEFHCFFSGNEPFSLRLNLNNANEEAIVEIDLNKYFSKENNGWWQVKIPLKEINFGDNLVSGLSIVNTSGQPQEPFYLDQVRFL